MCEGEDWEPVQCPIWGTPAKRKWSQGDYSEYFSARAGGRFVLTGTAAVLINGINKRGLSWTILQENLAGNVPRLDSHSLDDAARTNLRVGERFSLLMKVLADRLPDTQSLLNLRDREKDQSTFFLMSAAIGAEGKENTIWSESNEYLRYAELQGLLKLHTNGILTVTIPGYKLAEEIGANASRSNQIFVAMWFGSSVLKDYYELAIRPAVESSGYKCIRIDYQEHNEKIDDQILAEIRKSHAIIADLTCGLSTPNGWSSAEQVGSPRGGVFFEAGFAKGLGLPVIWTVKSDVADIENVSHFDVRQYNQIRWTTDFEEARQRIQLRIEATLGRGDYAAAN